MPEGKKHGLKSEKKCYIWKYRGTSNELIANAL